MNCHKIEDIIDNCKKRSKDVLEKLKEERKKIHTTKLSVKNAVLESESQPNIVD